MGVSRRTMRVISPDLDPFSQPYTLVMFDAFLLKLAVKPINKPDHVPTPPEVWEIRVLLSTTIYEIKELIWIHSENHSLSPPFLRIKMFGGPVGDLSSLDSILGLTEPPAYDNSIDALSVIIDYTLFGSPAIPHRDPIPLFFDVLVSSIINGTRRQTLLRESLGSTVRDIKDQIVEKYSLDRSAYGLKVPDGILCDDDNTLRDILGLDVPLPRNKRLELHLVERGTQLLKITERSSGRHFASINITNATTIQEVKSVASRYAAVPEHLVRLAYRAHIIAEPSVQQDGRTILDILQLEYTSNLPFEIEFDLKDEATTIINGEEWSPTGNTFVEVGDKNGSTRLVHQSALSSSTYVIDFQGTTVELDSSECIINDNEGYVLISPVGYSKIRNKWGGRVLKAQKRNSSQIDGSQQGAERVLQANPTLQPQVMQPPQQDDHGRREHWAQEADPVQLEEEIAERDQRRNIAGQRQTVFTRLIAAAMANRQNLRRIGINVFFMAMIGFDMLVLLTIPKFATAAVAFTFLYSVFIRGEEISDWLDHWILGEGAPNTVPFRIVRLISNTIRGGYNLYHFNFDRMYNFTSNLVMQLRPSRETLLERTAQRTDTVSFYVSSALKEFLSLVILFIATIIPTVETAFTEQDLTRRNGTKDRIVARIKSFIEEAMHRQDYASVKQYIEHVEGLLDDLYATEDCNKLVKAYFTVFRACSASPEEIRALSTLAGQAAGADAEPRDPEYSNDPSEERLQDERLQDDAGEAQIEEIDVRGDENRGARPGIRNSDLAADARSTGAELHQI